jgi:hypothetical protein
VEDDMSSGLDQLGAGIEFMKSALVIYILFKGFDLMFAALEARRLAP